MTRPHASVFDTPGVKAFDLAAEEEAHQRMLDLAPGLPDTLGQLSAGLAHPSWRVRKAAQAAASRLVPEASLVRVLVDGLGAQDNAGLRNACAEVLVGLGSAAVDALSAALSASDVDQRKFVVEVLGAIGNDSALRGLLNALEQPDSNVGAAVVDALGRIGGGSVIRLLRARLPAARGDTQLCAYLLDALARCGANLPFADLEPFLNERPLRRFIYPLLGLSRDATAFGVLLEALQSASRGDSRVAVPALAQLARGVPPPGEVMAALATSAGQQALNDALGDADALVVGAAIYLWSLSGVEEMTQKVAETAVAHGLIQVALDAFGRLGRRVLSPLLRAIDGSDVQTALLGLDGVEALGDAQAVPALLDLMTSQNLHIAGATIRVLGKLGDASTIEPLMRLASTREEPEISRQVVFALGRVGLRDGNAVADAMHRAIAAGDVQPGWVAVLGLLHRPQDIEVLFAACRHFDPDVRCAALDAAVAYAGAVPEGAVRAALRDENGRVRAAAARAARVYRSEACVDALLQALNDFDPWVVTEAARSLDSAPAHQAVPALQQCAESQLAPLAIAAMHSLARLQADDLQQTVRRAMRHSDSEVVREALHLAARQLPRGQAYAVLTEGLQHAAWDARWAAAEQLLALGLGVDAVLLQRCLDAESVPQVRARLEQLTQGRGGAR